MLEKPQIDFAISYAGEDLAVAKMIASGLREKGFSVFLADEQRHALVGEDGEAFFERLFTEAVQVIVLISQHYKKKPWTRFEWDIISQRQLENRYVPVRLDDSYLLGLPSKIIYIRWTGDNVQEVLDACATRLLLYERSAGFQRPGLYDEILRNIKESKRAVAKAYQLVQDRRRRPPLDDAPFPPGEGVPCYKIVESKWRNVGVVRRRAVKVRLSDGLTKEEVIFNPRHAPSAQPPSAPGLRVSPPPYRGA